MRFSDKSDEDLQINLTPLIDVVFLLLIFFMVSTTFSKESQLRIRLPEATPAEQAQEEKKKVEIQINEQGLYAIQGPGEEISRQLLKHGMDDLLLAIKDVAGGAEELLVIIRADRNTPHEAVIRAMDASRRLGYTEVTFATQQSVSDNGSE